MNDQEIEKFIKILPKIIQENDTVKGAIISALSGVMATKDDIKEVIKANKAEIKSVIEAMDRRFEEMNQRFEMMDKRFEAMNQRFEVMNQRFEVMNQRFEVMNQSIKDLTISITRIESKEGILFERTVLGLMKETLKLENISVDKIRKEFLSDKDGIIFFPGYITDIDVFLEDGNTYLVEIKATAHKQDVSHFLQNAKLYEKISNKKPTQLILIALRIHEGAQLLAEKLQVRVIFGEILPDVN